MIRESYVFYRSFISALENLDGETFKECILALSRYALDEQEYEGKNALVNMYLEMAKPQIDKNKVRYENGKKGGRPKTKENQEQTKENQTKPKETKNGKSKPNDNVNDNVNVNVNVNDIYTQAKVVLDYLNRKTGKAFRYTKYSLVHIVGRLNDGYTMEQCKRVIDVKCAKWLTDKKFKDYLRPQTLFAPTNFESYLNESLDNEYMHIPTPSERANHSDVEDVQGMIEKLKA